MGRKYLVLGEASKKKVQITDKFLDGIFLGIKVLNSIRGTPRRVFADDEQREPREPREQPLRIDVRPVRTDFLPVNTEPTKPLRVYIRNSVELARFGHTPGCIGCETAMTLGLRVTTRIIHAMSSDADLGARVTGALRAGGQNETFIVQPLQGRFSFRFDRATFGRPTMSFVHPTIVHFTSATPRATMHMHSHLDFTQ